MNVEHEEVLLVPRWIDCNRVTFKYGLGDEFIGILKTLHKLGLDSTRNVRVRDVEVAPRDVIAAVLPDPATLGDRMTGKTCAGTLVTGLGKDGEPRKTYLYHVVDNEWSMREYGSQAVVWQTALNPVVALELLAEGAWGGAGRARPGGVPGAAVPRQARRARLTARVLELELAVPTRSIGVPRLRWRSSSSVHRCPRSPARRELELEGATVKRDSDRAREHPTGYHGVGAGRAALDPRARQRLCQRSTRAGGDAGRSSRPGSRPAGNHRRVR